MTLLKRFQLLLFFLTGWIATAQIPAYYNGVDLTKTGIDLRDELATHIIATHDNLIDYQSLIDVLRQTDEVPNDPTKVFLIYGWEAGNDADCHNDIMRDENDNGGNSNDCDWNREHVYPKSLGTPNLGTSGPGSDAHHVRPSDVNMNSQRGSKKFKNSSGNAHVVNGNYWYPGDQWKGDVARIIMYMYLRYGSQCLPDNVGIGNPVTVDPDMIDLFLQWNADDPPSAVEDQRNTVLENIQGNRNPFIDNPYLATIIWGGPVALDRWNMSVNEEKLKQDVRVYPNPAHQFLRVQNQGEPISIRLTDTTGRVLRYQSGIEQEVEIPVESLPADVYWLIISTRKAQIIKPFIKN